MSRSSKHAWSGRGQTVLMVLLSLLPLVLLLLVLSGALPISFWIVMAVLILSFAAMILVMERPQSPKPGSVSREDYAPDATIEGEVPEEIILKVLDVIYPITAFRDEERLFIEGRLLMRPDAAYEALRRRFDGTPYALLLQESDAGRPVFMLVPSKALPAPSEQRGRPWINAALFVLTLGTMTRAGAAHRGVDILQDPAGLVAGIPYALALPFTLGAHELGYFFTARRYGMAVSLPYFIPVPFALGTFGAVIRLRSLAPSRRAMFDVAVAGPIAGLIIAIPALIIGLKYSSVIPEAAAPSMLMGGSDMGSSVLFAFLAKVALGDAMQEGHRLVLHPVAFAGWLGLFVTALNLSPVGQLDGGHMDHSLFGRKTARTVGMASLIGLVLFGFFVWSGVLFWALLIYLLAGTEDAPPLNAVMRLDGRRVALGAAALALLLLILVLVPHACTPPSASTARTHEPTT